MRTRFSERTNQIFPYIKGVIPPIAAFFLTLVSFFLLHAEVPLWLEQQPSRFENKPATGVTEEVNAFIKAYGKIIDEVGIEDGEIFFRISGKKIYYRGGKMLGGKNLARQEEYNLFFYKYNPGPLIYLPPHSEYPRFRSSDVLDAMFGYTEREIRSTCQWVSFLGRRAFMQELTVAPLKRVEARIQELADSSKEVRDFISEIALIYSFKKRKVIGTDNMSYHAYGLALDIIPRSYQGKHVYWRWSSELGIDWSSIPLNRRWQPPTGVILAFEENGFVWGGKWFHFDTVHFEYRPEILILAGLRPSQI